MPTEILPATRERFADVAAVLNPGGNPRACWCLSYRLPGSGSAALVGDERAALVRDLCSREPAPGLLAYVDGTPAGWCGVGPRADLHRLVHSRTIPAVDDLPVWSVVCFVVAAGHRGRGVTRDLLAGAIEHARAAGAPALEAYPLDNAGARVNPSFAYVGTTGLFEAAGFRRAAETRSRSGGVPRVVVRLAL